MRKGKVHTKQIDNCFLKRSHSRIQTLKRIHAFSISPGNRFGAKQKNLGAGLQLFFEYLQRRQTASLITDDRLFYR